MGLLGPIASAAGSAILGRTFLLETTTDNGIPRLVMVLDVVSEEEPTYSADVTEHAVEAGPEVTDHIQLKNPTLRLKGTISNTPLDLATSIANLAAGGLSIITSSQARSNAINSGILSGAGAIGATLLRGAALNPGPLLAGATDAIARTLFLSAFERKARFDVVTKRQKFPSMVIESMTFPRDASTGGQLVFELQLKHIRVISPQTVLIGTTAEAVANSATGQTSLGNQAATPVSAQTAAQVETTKAATDFTPTQARMKAGA